MSEPVLSHDERNLRAAFTGLLDDNHVILEAAIGMLGVVPWICERKTSESALAPKTELLYVGRLSIG
jgi:hypothetical protein